MKKTHLIFLILWTFLLNLSMVHADDTKSEHIRVNAAGFTHLSTSDGDVQTVLADIDSKIGGSSYYTWNSISATSQTLFAANAYIPTSASLTTFTLPASPALGDHYLIVGRGSGGWVLGQNASQTIYIGNKNTTTGTGGSLASTQQRDAIEIICIAANEFEVINSLGNITIN